MEGPRSPRTSAAWQWQSVTGVLPGSLVALLQEPGGPGGADQRRPGCGPALCIRPGEVHHPTPRFELFSLQRTGVLNRFGVVSFLFSFMGRKANGISG